MKATAAVFMIAVLLSVPGVSWSDGTEDQLRQAQSLYKQGNLSEAIRTLQVACALIEHKRTEQLLKLFPKPLKGWKAEDPSGEYMPYAIMGGGITAGRTYLEPKSGRTIEIEIITNPSLVEGVLMLMNNQFLAKQANVESCKIRDYSAVREFRSADAVGKISLIVQDRMLIELEGEGLDNDQVLRDYADKIDFAALEAFLAH